VSGMDDSLAHQVAIFMQNIRREDLLKKPGISETLIFSIKNTAC